MKISLTIEGTYLVETKKDNYYVSAENIYSLWLKCFILRLKEIFGKEGKR